MELTIISPTTKKIISVAWFEIDTTIGNFVIQQGHAPTVLIFAQQTIATVCLKSGKQETITIPGGVVEITRQAATFILTA